MLGPARLVPVLLLTASLMACGRSDPILVLTTTPADATVAVDGFGHPGGSPHEIVFKTAGRYKLSITRDGYQPVEMFVTLKKGERRDQTVELVADNMQIATDPLPPNPLPPNPLPPNPNPFSGQNTFKLLVSSTPSGANVTLREPGRPDVWHAGKTPLSVDLPDTRATDVVVSLPGYREHRRLVVAPHDGGDVSLDVVLSRKAGPGGGNPNLSNPLIPVDPPPIVPDDPGSYGFISINSNPWCSVHVDGKPMGNTPLVRVKVAAGHHTVLMENRDQGKRRKRSVLLRPGEHVRIVENFN